MLFDEFQYEICICIYVSVIVRFLKLKKTKSMYGRMGLMILHMFWLYYLKPLREGLELESSISFYFGESLS